jgi:uncharacterized protein with GYD domain
VNSLFRLEWGPNIESNLIHTPNEIIASVLYSTGSLGNIRTETLKAFSMAEAVNIIEKIS